MGRLQPFAVALTAGHLASAHFDGKYLLGYNVDAEEVCYTYITVVPATATAAPEPGYVTTTVGNPSITGPVTFTVPPSGTVPGTVVIETPYPSDPPGTVTITTGNPTITVPVTQTVPATGTVPGTVVIETPDPAPEVTPPSTVTITTGNPSITGPVTRTVPGIGTVPGTVIVETPFPPASPDPSPSPTPSPSPSPTTSDPPASPTPPPFDCDAGGYLIQGQELYRLDLATGENVLINDNVGPGPSINAIGYNTQDNYIWGMLQASEGADLVRIDSAGEATVYPLGLTGTWITGDVDDQNRLWIHTIADRWAVIDIDSESETFGTVLEEGTTELPVGYIATDWAFIPGGGQFIYSIIHANGVSGRARFSTLTHIWYLLESYGVVTDEPTTDYWGAMYSAGNGFLYASENASGQIWRFPVINGGAPQLVTDGPASSSNDGARCVLAPDPPVEDPQIILNFRGGETASGVESSSETSSASASASASASD